MMTFASASEIARRIRERDISAVEAVEMHLARIDAVNPMLNAVVTRCDEMALKRARDADAALAKGKTLGALHGVPITVKDVFDTAGVRSTGGTKGREHFIPKTNATAVERLLSAGAILIGKTNTPELTLFYDTDNLVFGKTFNPYRLSCSPGGSSGGSAAIVAAGGSPLDLGSDIGGSIRLPAHFCGVSGIKPTAGRVPKSGQVVPAGLPIDQLSQVGPIARFVDDLALVLPIISGVDWKDSSAVPVPLGNLHTVRMNELSVTRYLDNGIFPVSPAVAAAVHDCARIVADQGAKVEKACPPGIEKTMDLFSRIFNTDGGAWVRRILERTGTKEIYPFLNWTNRQAGGSEEPASAFTALLQEWEQFRVGMLGFMRGYDVILAPVHSYAALPHAELISPELSPAFSYSQTYNLTGWPSVVVRAGTSDTGLPIGVQVVARPWREDVALAVAKRIEQAQGWQAPPAFHML